MVARRISPNFKTLSKWFSDEGLTRKASLNAIASTLDYGTRLVVGFVIIPLLVTGLGSYGYGVWQVLGRLVGSISPAGGRSTQTLKWTIANHQASTDYEEKRRQVGSAVFVWLLFLPFLLLLGGLLAWFAPIWLDAPVDVSQSVRVAAAILIVNLIIVNMTDVPRSVLTGENLGYKRMGLSALLVAIGGGFTALALYLKAGLMGVAAANLAATVLTGLLFLRVARTHVPWFGVARPLAGALRGFLGLSGWFLVWGLVMRLMRASDVVILGILDSPELVTTYTLTKYAPEVLISFVAIMVFGITPGLGGIIGSGNLQKAIRVRNEIMSFTWLLVTVVGATILLWNQSFVRLWVGQEYYAGPIPTLLMMGMVSQFVFIRNDANIIDLTLDLRRKVLIGLLSTMISIIVGGVLVGPLKMGIMGLCVGFIAGRFILTFSYPWIVGRYLGVSQSSQLKSIVRPALVTLLLFAFMAHLDSVVTASTGLGLILSVGVTLALVSLVAFFTGLSSTQQKHISQRVRLVAPSAVSNGHGG